MPKISAQCTRACTRFFEEDKSVGRSVTTTPRSQSPCKECTKRLPLHHCNRSQRRVYVCTMCMDVCIRTYIRVLCVPHKLRNKGKVRSNKIYIMVKRKYRLNDYMSYLILIRNLGAKRDIERNYRPTRSGRSGRSCSDIIVVKLTRLFRKFLDQLL